MCFDVTTQMELLQGFKGSRVQGGSAYSKVRQRLKEVWKESQVNGLMLVIQGRLAW